jgi:hypothetical protein
MLPKNAKLYITLVIASGLAVVLLAAKSWSSASLSQFMIYLGLAALASTLKIRIPGVESTITPNFVFLLLAVNACSFSEVVAISAVMAVVQCIWRSAKRPRLVQVTFSVAALVLSAAAAYQLSHFLLAGNAWDSAIGSVIVAGCIYFPLNSLLVALVIGLASGQSLGETLSRGDGWVFPYFVGGIVFAALISAGYNSTSLWKGALTLIPLTALAHAYFLNRQANRIPARPPA